jgi:hypothetical protein
MKPQLFQAVLIGLFSALFGLLGRAFVKNLKNVDKDLDVW